MPRSARLLVVLLIVACGGSGEPAIPVVTEPAPGAAEVLEIVPQAAIDAAEGRVLAPSPLELDAAVHKVGLAETLGALVPTRTYDMTATDPGAIAVRTGVMLADTVFTGESAPTEVLVARAESVRDGLRGIGASDALVATIDEIIGRLKSGASTRTDILAEVDAITSSMVPEDGWGPADRSGPLVQAGVWLEGANLVAAACVEKGETVAANGLLRDRELVAYFLRYVQTKGADHAPSPVVDKLVETLQEMQTLTAKEQLDLGDVKRIHELTGSVLALL